MGNELTPTQPQKSYSEIFEEQCSFYMSIGMSYEEYWRGDSAAPKYYRETYKKKQEQVNYEAWLYGLYFYDALTSALSHMNSNKSTHSKYAEKPYSFTPDELEKDNENKVIEAQAQAEVWMKSWVSATQKMFKNE